jgi:hypothetical protein
LSDTDASAALAANGALIRLACNALPDDAGFSMLRLHTTKAEDADNIPGAACVLAYGSLRVQGAAEDMTVIDGGAGYQTNNLSGDSIGKLLVNYAEGEVTAKGATAVLVSLPESLRTANPDDFARATLTVRVAGSRNWNSDVFTPRLFPLAAPYALSETTWLNADAATPWTTPGGDVLDASVPGVYFADSATLTFDLLPLLSDADAAAALAANGALIRLAFDALPDDAGFSMLRLYTTKAEEVANVPNVDSVLAAIPQTVWRFYSKNYRGHFFTISEQERDGLIEGNPNWKFEGGAYQAYTNEVAGTVALHRFYSKNYRGHFFTIDEEEMQTVRDTNPNWKYEGVAYYVYPEEVEGSVPVHRFWSKGYRHHFYTINEEEKDTLIATNPNWTYERIAFWALPLEGEAVQGGEEAQDGDAQGRQASRTRASRPNSGRIGGGVVVTTCDGSDGSAVVDGDEGTGWSPVVAAGDRAWVVLSFEEPLEVAWVEVMGDNLPEGLRVLWSADAEEWEEIEAMKARYVWVAWEAGVEGTVVNEIGVRDGNSPNPGRDR